MSIKLFFAIFFLTSRAEAGEKNDYFQLVMGQSSCEKPTLDFSSSGEASESDGMLKATLNTAINCAAIASNPNLFVSDYGITLAIDEASPSGAYTACKCRVEINYSFVFPEFEEYNLNHLFFTVNGAVVEQVKILNKSIQPTADAPAD